MCEVIKSDRLTVDEEATLFGDEVGEKLSMAVIVFDRVAECASAFKSFKAPQSRRCEHSTTAPTLNLRSSKAQYEAR
eukprot:4550780-Amphidinium_carterae.1